LVSRENGFQTLCDKLNVGARRADTGLGLLLKSVQHVDTIAKPHGIHRSISISPMILD